MVEAAIEADASVADVPRSPNLPPSFDKTSRTNVLSFDTDAPIIRYLQSDRAAPSASTIYADILVKGAPYLADASVPEAGADAKILVYTRISQSGSETNLCVYAKDAAGDGVRRRQIERMFVTFRCAACRQGRISHQEKGGTTWLWA